MKIEEFWASTPHEINQYSRGRLDKIKAEVEVYRSMVWSAAALSRTSKFPSYNKWMGNEKQPSPEKLEELGKQHQAMIASLAKQRSRKKDEARGN